MATGLKIFKTSIPERLYKGVRGWGVAVVILNSYEES